MTIRNLQRLALGVILFGISCAPVENPTFDLARPNEEQPGSLPTADPSKKPPLPPKELRKPPSPEQLSSLKVRIEAALDQVKHRKLLASHSSWTVFHGILGIGLEAELYDRETGETVNAVDHIMSGGHVRGLSFIPTAHGLDVKTGPPHVGQGHQDQYAAEIAQLGIPFDRKLIVYGKEYKFGDLVTHAPARASTRKEKNQELSWTLVVLSQYYGTDFSWTNEDGDKLHFEDLVKYELDASVEQSACGGTHRLFGLTWAYYLHRKNGGKKTGLWVKVAEKIEHYQKMARELQNPDGSFSTQYLEKPENQNDKQRRINTTGHVLEWLALSLPTDDLKSAWMQDAASALSLMILRHAKDDLESGGLYHAAHGLTMYYARVFGGKKAEILPAPPKD